MKKLALLLLVPIVSFSQVKEIDFNNVEIVPIYPGCEFYIKNQQLKSCFQEKIQIHIVKNLRYPKIAQKKKFKVEFLYNL
jgi:protein TonB